MRFINMFYTPDFQHGGGGLSLRHPIPVPVGYVSVLLPIVSPGGSKAVARGENGPLKRGARVADFCTGTICIRYKLEKGPFRVPC